MTQSGRSCHLRVRARRKELHHLRICFVLISSNDGDTGPARVWLGADETRKLLTNAQDPTDAEREYLTKALRRQITTFTT